MNTTRQLRHVLIAVLATLTLTQVDAARQPAWPAASPEDRAHFCGDVGDRDGTQPLGYARRLNSELSRRLTSGRSVQQVMADLSAIAVCQRSTWLEPFGSRALGA